MKRADRRARRLRVVDELGAHVSAAGGVENAPARAALLRARTLQLFTKSPNRWADPELSATSITAFRAAREACGIEVAAAHDSYLINLGSPDPALLARSLASFVQELRRCAALGLEYLVSHPGTATDGDRVSAIERNADALLEAIDAVPDGPMILLETTAGAGRALGASFEELYALLDATATHANVGVCLDTCHVWAAGYDLRADYDAVLHAFDDTIGLDRLRLLHLNDSAAGLGSRRDRHVHIGKGALGDTPFCRLLTDDRLTRTPKVIETPKDGDAVAADRRNLRRLRSYRRFDRGTERG